MSAVHGSYGGYGGPQYGYTKDKGINLDLNLDLTIDICPDILLSAIAVIGAAFFFFLYSAITMAGRRRRRKRSTPVQSSLCSPGDEILVEIDQEAAVCHKAKGPRLQLLLFQG
jgi:hypothetical protein